MRRPILCHSSGNPCRTERNASSALGSWALPQVRLDPRLVWGDALDEFHDHTAGCLDLKAALAPGFVGDVLEDLDAFLTQPLRFGVGVGDDQGKEECSGDLSLEGFGGGGVVGLHEVEEEVGEVGVLEADVPVEFGDGVEAEVGGVERGVAAGCGGEEDGPQRLEGSGGPRWGHGAIVGDWTGRGECYPE